MAKDKVVKKSVKNVKPQENQEEQQSGIWQDERFQHLVTDPRFKNLPKTERKVKIDKRFQSMFTDDKFKVKYTVDKYGRHVNKSNAEDLRKYYELEGDSSDEESAEIEEQRKEEKALLAEAKEESGSAESASDVDAGENDELVSDGEDTPKTLRQQLCDPNVDYARGECRLLTDSSSDEESSEEEEEEDLVANIDHVWGELAANAETTDESTRRLAVCNMDWDRIRAVDLMVLLSSFLPPGGSILSVKIYPSEYGKQRLAEEEHHGPPELVGLAKKEKKKLKVDLSDSEEELVQAQDSDAEEGDEYHMEKLRQYQLNRLRYYYAVVECDSIETADKIYKECDGIEYESSAILVDLRFIPDDTSFDEDVPSDVCTQLPDTTRYKPRQFTTTALQQVKVDLTWDETAVERKELGDKLSSGKLDEVNDKELRTIVAYSSEEEEDDDDDEEKVVEEKSEIVKETTENIHKSKKSKKEDAINKYKALLAEINEKEKTEKNKKYEMEFTWEVTDDTKTEKNDQEAVEEKYEEKQELTPMEKILKKRSEKNKKRKEERKRRALLAKGIDPDTAGKQNDSDSDSIPDGIDMNDAYFAEEFANGDFVDTKQKPKQKKKKQKQRSELEAEEKEQEKEAEELALMLDDVDSTDKNHFSLEKILKAEQETKSKRKRRKQLKKSKSAFAEEQQVEDNFELNVADERFKNIYSSHLFNIDPTDSHFKKTKGMEKLIQEKLKRRERNELQQEEEEKEDGRTLAKKPKKQIENSLLVNSLKRKLQQHK